MDATLKICGHPKADGTPCRKRIDNPPCWVHRPKPDGDEDAPLNFYNAFNAERRETFLEHIRNGSSITGAAGAVPVSRPTVYAHMEKDPAFAAEVRAAQDACVGEVEETLWDTAVSGNPTAMIFLLTNRASDRWQDRRSIRGEHTITEMPAVQYQVADRPPDEE